MKFSVMLLLLFFIFPFIVVDALICDVGGICTPFSNWTIETNISTSNNEICDDSCLYFHCIPNNKNGKVMIGYGCFEHFKYVCKNLTSKTKALLKENNYFSENHFTYFDSNLLFYSCNDSNNCVKNTNFASIFNLNETKIFGKYANHQNYSSETCIYIDKPKSERHFYVFKFLGLMFIVWIGLWFWFT